jgi:hypothetical protein
VGKSRDPGLGAAGSPEQLGYARSSTEESQRGGHIRVNLRSGAWVAHTRPLSAVIAGVVFAADRFGTRSLYIVEGASAEFEVLVSIIFQADV